MDSYTLFIISALLILAAYIGYGLLLELITRIKMAFTSKKRKDPEAELHDLPDLTVVIPAYNEAECISAKIRNTCSLNYPSEKLTIAVLADGSTDETATIVRDKFDGQVMLFHHPIRRGKTAAMNRIMPMIDTPITVFTDANTELSENALLELVAPFADKRIGMVSGEKRVLSAGEGAGESEGVYWRYESWLKQLDARLCSVMGTAGELFAIRTEAYETLPESTILDDFMQSIRLMSKDLKIGYAHQAVATEYGSATVAEEMKRKVRIAAGGIQSTAQSLHLLNPLRFGWVSFCLFTHRIFRWTLAPLLLLVMMAASFVWSQNSGLGAVIFSIQFSVLVLALYHWKVEELQLPKLMRVPVYFYLMHVAVIAGWVRHFSGNQPATWEKVRRVSVG